MREIAKRVKEIESENKAFGFIDSLENIVSQALVSVSVKERVLIMNESGSINSGMSASKMNKNNIKYVISILEVA